jgi:2-hydroxychromene-2-carboxylate isomerase
MTRSVDWYFDFISPFSYLQTARFGDLPNDVAISFKPVLFAGLLKHWGTVGPAEVAPKRTFTYRHCLWLARRLGVPFRMPPAHPFSPLRALRLCIARGVRREDVLTIFRVIWVDGQLPDTEGGWRAIGRAVGVDDADALICGEDVKQTLREATAGAIAAGVFGVPTFVFAGTPFWGVDATDFLIDVLNDPSLLNDAEMRRIATLPASAQRSGR